MRVALNKKSVDELVATTNRADFLVFPKLMKLCIQALARVSLKTSLPKIKEIVSRLPDPAPSDLRNALYADHAHEVRKALFNLTCCPSTLIEHTGLAYSIALSTDGTTIASSAFYDRTIRMYQLKDCSWQKVQTLRWHPEEKEKSSWERNIEKYMISSIALSVDGKTIVFGSSDKTIRVCQFKDGSWQEVQILRGHISPVNSVALSANGKTIVSGSYDRTIKVWHLKDGSWRKVQTLIEGYSSSVYSVVLSTDGKMIVCGSYDGVIRVWHLKDGSWQKEPTLPMEHLSSVYSVALSTDGRTIVSCSSDENSKV